MSYSSILTVLTGAASDAVALSAAAEFAQRDNARVTAVLALPTFGAEQWATFGNFYMSPDLVDGIQRQNAAARRRAEALVQDLTVSCGLELSADAGRIVLAPEQSDFHLDLSAELPFCDLLVVGQETLTGLGVWSGLISTPLFKAMTPLMVVEKPLSECGAGVAIAWDGSLSAARAVRTAMPLIKTAPHVVILHDADHIADRNRMAADPDLLADYLGLHGVKRTDIVRLSGASRDDGLARLAREYEAGLLVSGAFGHSRLQEEILGGSTEALMKARAGLNLFVAH